MPKYSTIKSFTALGATLNFIDVWFKLFLDNYRAIFDAYVNAMKDMFKQISLTMKKRLTPKQKVQKIMTDICGGWYMKKSAKGLPPLRRTKLIKKVQERQYEGQRKIYVANKWWNDWIFQFHWHKLEWLNPKYLIKRDKPYSLSSIFLLKYK